MSTNKELRDINYSALNLCKKINTPLVENFNIELFTYRRLYLNGKFFQLTSKKNWIDKSLSDELYISKEILPKISKAIQEGTQSFLWSGNVKDSLYEALYDYDIWNGISFYENRGSYIDIFAFSSVKENTQAQNFYINNLDLLSHYKGFFRSKLFEYLGEDKIIKSSVNINNQLNLSEFNFDKSEYHANFLRQTTHKKYILTHQDQLVILSPREAEVLYWQTKGFRTKEIAQLLVKTYEEQLSPRTIETYINSIKMKFGTTDRISIIFSFLNSDIPSQIEYFLKASSETHF